MKKCVELPKKKEEWQTTNIYFHGNLDLQCDITNIENEVSVSQSCIYDYFKLINDSNNPDYTWNFLSRESNHLSRRQLKKALKV